MIVDEVDITFQAGNGGNGSSSYYRGYKTGPDGGNGGDGGNIYLTATSDLSRLLQLRGKTLIKAQDGEKGDKRKKSGKKGQDTFVTLPIGSILKNLDTGHEFNISDLSQKVLYCHGGIGGKGTYYLASPANTTPLSGEPGHPGEKKRLKIILKLIADFGLIGLPNAGKSSILNELTKANVKVADYPFTTLEPNLGTMGKIIIADIPGLIEGASSGKGLGIKFLKHIEKVKLLLHCISAESENPDIDYRIVRKELADFNPELSKKPEIILLTKSDLLSDKDLAKREKILKKHAKVYLVSLLDDRFHPANLPVLKSDFNPVGMKIGIS